MADIPDCIYELGVPITFLNKFCPKQFRIIGKSSELAGPIQGKERPGRFYFNGKRLYERIIIRKEPRRIQSVLDLIRLNVSRDEIIKLIYNLQRADDSYDNLRNRNPLVRFDSNIRGYIGELGVQNWLTKNGVRFYQPTRLGKSVNIDLVLLGKKELTVEIKTSTVSDTDRTIIGAIKNRDIKVFVDKRTPYVDSKPFIGRDLFLQIYYPVLRKQRDDFCMSLYNEYGEHYRFMDPEELYNVLNYEHIFCFLTAWKDKDGLLTDLYQEEKKIWSYELRDFWKCPLTKAYAPNELLWFIR